MIRTKDFIVINYPKTGSTYMRECIKKLYRENTIFNKIFHKDDIFEELILSKIYGNTPKNYKDQHGVVRQIPSCFRNQPIVTVTRNPIQRIVSSYHFEWWKRNPLYDLSEIQKHYPAYPEIDLVTFAKLLNNVELTHNNLLRDYANELGYNTRLFLIFYSDNPMESAEKLILGNSDIKEVVKQNIHFLRQESLQKDLMSFVDNNTSKDAQLMSSVENKNSGSYKIEKQLPNEFIEYVIQMESHLFKSFYPEIFRPL